MSDYRIDTGIDGEPTRFGAAAEDLAETIVPRSKVAKALDKAEGMAAKRLGAPEAHRLREQADVAIARGQGAYEEGRVFLDKQLAAAPYRTVAAAAVAGLLAGVFLTPRKKKVVYVRGRRGAPPRA